MEPADNRLPEKEALELIARVFESNMRRMNRVRGGHFILWGTVLTLRYCGAPSSPSSVLISE